MPDRNRIGPQRFSAPQGASMAVGLSYNEAGVASHCMLLTLDENDDGIAILHLTPAEAETIGRSILNMVADLVGN